jgi:hypothetical protein
MFNAERLDQLTRGKSKRILSVIDSLRGIFADSESLMAEGFTAIASGDRAAALSTFIVSKASSPITVQRTWLN